MPIYDNWVKQTQQDLVNIRNKQFFDLLPIAKLYSSFLPPLCILDTILSGMITQERK